MMQSAIIILFTITVSIVIAFVVLRRLRHTEVELKQKNKELERRLYELSVSQSVSEQIGYSLNIATILDSLVETAGHLITHSTISYALVDGKTITLKIIEKDFVGPIFLEDLKKQTLDYIFERVQSPHELQTIESVRKEFISSEEKYVNEKPASFFGMPLSINERCVGAISFASSKTEAFSSDDKELLKRTIENTLLTVGKLEDVIKTEKSKLDSFLFSLSSGALLFLIDGDILKLSAINAAAKTFLHVGEDPDTTQVIAHFGMHYDLIKDIKEIALQKKSMVLKDVTIYDRSFKIYMNPVFLHSKNAIIGVAVTMEDVTFERDVEKIRETFTSMVVHELRAPLTSIKGASQMLLSGKLQRVDSEKMLHIIGDSTERMLSEIGDILDMSKLEAGKFTLNKTTADINQLIKDKELAFSFIAQTRHIEITDHLDEHLPKTFFDVTRVGQVLNNLFSNALKFTPDNGKIIATTTFQNDQITVSVSDNGVGVPPEKMALLFSKYGQLEGSLRHEGGTGLGLYISKEIVESHGGKIWLDSKPGQGATVSFTLPVITKVEQEKDAPVVPASKIIPQKTLN